MSTAQFTCPLIVTIPGQLIASSLWNNEFVNLFNNINPQGVGAYSDTNSQMQTQTDPFPGSSISRPSALSGELERIRYAISGIVGQSFWYQHPIINLDTTYNDIVTLQGVIPSGTVMVFYQAAPPAGWTQVTSQNDKALRVVSGSGGGVGGADAFSTNLSHEHVVASHTHDLSNHTHTMANHTHTSAAHTHTVTHNGWNGHSPSVAGELAIYASNGASVTGLLATSADIASGSTTPGVTGAPSTNTSDGPSTNTSGAAAPATDLQLNIAFAYIDVILAQKN